METAEGVWERVIDFKDKLSTEFYISIDYPENAAEFLEFAEQYGMADTIAHQRDKQLDDMNKTDKKFRRQCLICLTFEDGGCALDGNRCGKCNHDAFRLINIAEIGL